MTSINQKDWILSKLPYGEENRVRRWLKGLSSLQYMEAMEYLLGRLRHHETGNVSLPADLDDILCVSLCPEDRKGPGVGP